MIPSGYFLAVAALLFVLGIIAFFVKKNLIGQFMAVEVMLNAANLAFLALARGVPAGRPQTIVLFVITVAAAEAAVGLAVIVLVFRRRKTIASQDWSGLKG